jgi:hypothetical protein
MYPNSNLAGYDVHPWHTAPFEDTKKLQKFVGVTFPYTYTNTENDELKSRLNKFHSQDFRGMLCNDRGLKNVSLTEIYESGESFIYPYILYDNNLFYKYDTIEVDPRVIERVKQGKAKIVFTQMTEGFFGESEYELIWLSNLSYKYNIPKDGLVAITANFASVDLFNNLLVENKIIDNITVWPFSYFQYTLWFHEKSITFEEETKNLIRSNFYEFLDKNKTEKKSKHFLCFNRVPKVHRILMFGELMSNPNLKDKSIATLGAKNVSYGGGSFFDTVNYFLDDEYKHSKELLKRFYESYNDAKHSTYDKKDMHINFASNLNKPAHSSTFVNIVTESLINTNSIFFSEKTYKPIYCAQPFIIFGNPHSLRVLKDLGFKTFDKWWDESYDNEVNLTRRFEKIVSVLNEISSWSLEDCFKVTQEMEDIFIHNMEVMISNEKVIEMFKFLAKK